MIRGAERAGLLTCRFAGFSENSPRALALLPLRFGQASRHERKNSQRAKNPETTKVLLLGLGRWGVNHLRNLNPMPVELYVAGVGAKQLEPARKPDWSKLAGMVAWLGRTTRRWNAPTAR